MKICVSGQICSGKSTLSRYMAEHFNFHTLSFGQILRDYSHRVERSTTRESTQTLGEWLIHQYGYEGFLNWIIRESNHLDWTSHIVIDGVRHPPIFHALRQQFPHSILIYCYCEEETALKRLIDRDGIHLESARNILSHSIEKDIQRLYYEADMVFMPHESHDDFLSRFKDKVFC